MQQGQKTAHRKLRSLKRFEDCHCTGNNKTKSTSRGGTSRPTDPIIQLESNAIELAKVMKASRPRGTLDRVRFTKAKKKTTKIEESFCQRLIQLILNTRHQSNKIEHAI